MSNYNRLLTNGFRVRGGSPPRTHDHAMDGDSDQAALQRNRRHPARDRHRARGHRSRRRARSWRRLRRRGAAPPSIAHSPLPTASCVATPRQRSQQSRTQCTTAGNSYTVNYTPNQSGFSVNSLGTQPCPPTTIPIPYLRPEPAVGPDRLDRDAAERPDATLSLVVRSP